jgi:hypothetical protein
MKSAKSKPLSLTEAQTRVAQLEHALQLHLDFLGSLPHGWLGKTVADIGTLNEAYIASRKLGMRIT